MFISFKCIYIYNLQFQYIKKEFLKRKMSMTENHAVQVSCRIPKKLLTGIKNIGRPGTIVSTTMNQFYKVKINESTLETGTTITCPDESMLLISHNKDKILLTVTKGDQVMVIDFDEKTACHLILKLNLLVNLDR